MQLVQSVESRLASRSSLLRDHQGKHLESILSSAGDYEVWLTTQLLQPEMEDYEFSSQLLSEADTLPISFSQPLPFDS